MENIRQIHPEKLVGSCCITQASPENDHPMATIYHTLPHKVAYQQPTFFPPGFFPIVSA